MNPPIGSTGDRPSRLEFIVTGRKWIKTISFQNIYGGFLRHPETLMGGLSIK